MAAMFRVRTTLLGWQGAPGLMTHYFGELEGTSVPRATNAKTAADHVRAGLTSLTSVEPNIWTAQVQSVVDVIDPANGSLIESCTVIPPAVVTGAEGTKFGPAPSGICVTYLTDAVVSGKRVRGRCFVVPINDGLDANGTPTAAHVTSAGNFAAGMIGIGEATFCVWHRPTSPGGTDGSAHPVTGYRVADRYSVLRSRR